MRKIFRSGLKTVFLTLYLFICFAVASAVAGLAGNGSNPAAAVALLEVCFLISLTLSYLINRSRWCGWTLVAAIGAVMFGIMTFLTQIETLVFLNYLVTIIPVSMVPRLIVQGALVAALYAPVAVFTHGKLRAGASITDAAILPPLSAREWAWKLVLIAAVYLVIYVGFGYFVFVRLAGDAFTTYYAGLRMPGWMLPFQAARAVVWAALAALLLRLQRGNRLAAGFGVALAFSVLMGSLLLPPNDFMPDVIRQAHLTEVTSSNFVFGWLTALILTWRPRHIASFPVGR